MATTYEIGFLSSIVESIISFTNMLAVHTKWLKNILTPYIVICKRRDRNKQPKKTDRHIIRLELSIVV